MKVKVKVNDQAVRRIKKELGIDIQLAMQKFADEFIPSLLKMADMKKEHPEMDLRAIAEKFKMVTKKDENAKD